MKLLFLTAWFPYPPNNGSKLRIFHLLKGLAKDHQVTLLSYTDDVEAEIPPELAELCQAVYTVQSRPYQPNSLRALAGFFSPKPRVLVDRHVPEMAERIRALIKTGAYDLVIASQWYMAAYAGEFGETPALFEEAEIGLFADQASQVSGVIRRLRRQLTMLKMKLYFRRLLPRFRACTVASEPERQLLQSLAPTYTDIALVPNGVDVEEYAAVRETREPETLIFTGALSFSANYGGIHWFLEEVYPLIREEVPGVRLTITGDHAGRSLPNLKNVILTGHVKDVRPLVAASGASLAPLLTGGGTRLKILEAMALRTPVIATSKGAEGLEARHEEHLLIADTPEDFALAAIRLMTDQSLRRRITANALQLVREKYNWAVILPGFVKLAEQVAGGAPQGFLGELGDQELGNQGIG